MTGEHARGGGRASGWWAVSVGALLGVLGQATLEFILNIVSGRVIASAAWFSGVTLVALVVVILFLRDLGGRILGLYAKAEELGRDARVSFRYYRLDAGAVDRAVQAERLYAEAKRVIDYAEEDGQSRILAVNSFVEIGGQAGDEQVMARSRSYLQSIDRKLGKVNYHRIIQLAEADLARLPHGSVAPLIAENYSEHYRRMLQVSENSPGQRAAVLEAVPAKYPTSYLMVQNKEDGQYGGRLIWQMHEHVPDGVRGDEVQLTGLIIIIDPGGSILRTFVEWFEELRKSTLVYRLTAANLAPEPAPEPERAVVTYTSSIVTAALRANQGRIPWRRSSQ
jgi:hypothetical protein